MAILTTTNFRIEHRNLLWYCDVNQTLIRNIACKCKLKSKWGQLVRSFALGNYLTCHKQSWFWCEPSL